MSDANNLKMDIVDLILGLKLDKKNAEVLMLDFEKTSPYHSVIGGIIMDVGYNFVDINQSITANNMSKPAENFIRDNTAKVVYEVLKNPVFYNELSKLQRIKKESNAFLYDYYMLLEGQDWFSKDISEQQLATEFSNFMYFRAKQLSIRYEKHLINHSESMEYWESKGTYQEDPINSPAAKKRFNAEVRYDRAKGIANRIDTALQQEFRVEGEIDSGYSYLNAKLGKIQAMYQQSLYDMQTKNLTSINSVDVSPLNYKASWEKDKNIFQEIGYADIIEPWGKIMGDLRKKLQSNKNLLAVSAYNIGSEESDFEITSRWLGTPEYANFIDEYRSFCMQNLVAKLTNIKTEDLVNLIYSSDEGAVKKSMETLIKTGAAQSISLQSYIRDLNQKPEYAQSHTGVKDAFEQSSALVDTIRREVQKVVSERK